MVSSVIASIVVIENSVSHVRIIFFKNAILTKMP